MIMYSPELDALILIGANFNSSYEWQWSFEGSEDRLQFNFEKVAWFVIGTL